MRLVVKCVILEWSRSEKDAALGRVPGTHLNTHTRTMDGVFRKI